MHLRSLTSRAIGAPKHRCTAHACGDPGGPAQCPKTFLCFERPKSDFLRSIPWPDRISAASERCRPSRNAVTFFSHTLAVHWKMFCLSQCMASKLFPCFFDSLSQMGASSSLTFGMCFASVGISSGRSSAYISLTSVASWFCFIVFDLSYLALKAGSCILFGSTKRLCFTDFGVRLTPFAFRLFLREPRAMDGGGWPGRVPTETGQEQAKGPTLATRVS